jgi:hypothetical protein
MPLHHTKGHHPRSDLYASRACGSCIFVDLFASMGSVGRSIRGHRSSSPMAFSSLSLLISSSVWDLHTVRRRRPASRGPSWHCTRAHTRTRWLAGTARCVCDCCLLGPLLPLVHISKSTHGKQVMMMMMMMIPPQITTHTNTHPIQPFYIHSTGPSHPRSKSGKEEGGAKKNKAAAAAAAAKNGSDRGCGGGGGGRDGGGHRPAGGDVAGGHYQSAGEVFGGLGCWRGGGGGWWWFGWW